MKTAPEELIEKCENEIGSWNDENNKKPKKSGEYLCLVKWHDSDKYQYAILEYDIENKWQVTDSCEHLLWSELLPSPFNNDGCATTTPNKILNYGK
jgi:hypothetical protein